jgi:hypothetical protein
LEDVDVHHGYLIALCLLCLCGEIFFPQTRIFSPLRTLRSQRFF